VVEAHSSKEKATNGVELGNGDQRRGEALEDERSTRRRPAGLSSTGGTAMKAGDVSEGDGKSASFGPDSGAHSSEWMCVAEMGRRNVLRGGGEIMAEWRAVPGVLDCLSAHIP
jgi:hypothetical protein